MSLQWIDIDCSIEMSQMAFNHLLSLSLSFHLRRKTGEILRILDRGAAINRIFELLLFNILPVFIDIFVAIGIFVWKFDWGFAGAPLAVVVTQSLMPVMLLLYVCFIDGSQCWGGFTKRSLVNWREYHVAAAVVRYR